MMKNLFSLLLLALLAVSSTPVAALQLRGSGRELQDGSDSSSSTSPSFYTDDTTGDTEISDTELNVQDELTEDSTTTTDYDYSMPDDTDESSSGQAVLEESSYSTDDTFFDST